jgi:hypothetical protein
MPGMHLWDRRQELGGLRSASAYCILSDVMTVKVMQWHATGLFVAELLLRLSD